MNLWWLLTLSLALGPAARASTTIDVGTLSVDTTFSLANSPVILTMSVTIMPGVTLTFQPGVQVQSNGFTLHARGAVVIVGSSSQPVVFIGDGTGVAITQTSESTSNIQIKHATFSQYSSAVYSACCHQGALSIEDSTFAYTDTALTGYTGYMVYVRRCLFEHNTGASNGADRTFENCTFRNHSGTAIYMERNSVTGSLFEANNVAYYGGGGSITNCTFKNNDIAYKTHSHSASWSNNVITGNRVGLQVEQAFVGSFSNNVVCGNTEWNMYLTIPSDVDVKSNYWGSTDLDVVKSWIRDGFHAGGLGLALTDPVLSSASYGACANTVFKPGVVLSTSLILSAVTWTLADSPYSLTQEVVIYPSGSLVIQAGVQVQSNGFTLKARGALNVSGSATQPVVFIGDGTGVAITQEAVASSHIHVQHAAFSHYSSAVYSACCHQGALSIEDSTFAYADTALTGYSGYMVYVRRCLFEHNTGASNGADRTFENCTFRNHSGTAIYMERNSVTGSLFEANNVAYNGGGGVVTNSVFVNNDIAYRTHYHGCTFTGNVITGNRVGVQADHAISSGAFTKNSVCGNTDWNVVYNAATDGNFSCNWWGISDGSVAVRTSMKDAYSSSVSSTGIILIGPTLLAPMPAHLADAQAHACIQAPCQADLHCSGHGYCDGHGDCVCLSGWQGAACDECPFQAYPSGACAPSCGNLTTCNACLLSNECAWCPDLGVCSDFLSNGNLLPANCYSLTRAPGTCGNQAATVLEARFDVTATRVAVSVSALLALPGVLGDFDCNDVFDLATVQLLGSGHRCFWTPSDAATLVITLGIQYRLRPYLYTLCFKDQAVPLAMTGTLSASFVVEPPAVLPTPVARYRAQFQQSLYRDMLLDGSMSADASGSLRFLWSCLGCPPIILPYLEACDHPAVLLIPKALLSEGDQYLFTLTVTNIFGRTASFPAAWQGNYTITVFEPALLEVALEGEPELEVEMGQSLLITSRVQSSEEDTPLPALLEYDWALFRLPDRTTDVLQQLGLIASPGKVVVPANVLEPGQQYELLLNVSPDEVGYFLPGFSTLLLTALLPPLSLRLSAVGLQADNTTSAISEGHSLLLVATPNDPAHLAETERFVWLCLQPSNSDLANASFAACPADLLAVLSGADPDNSSLMIPASALSAGWYTFSVIWSKLESNRTAQAGLTLRIAQAAEPPPLNVEVTVLVPSFLSDRDHSQDKTKPPRLQYNADTGPLVLQATVLDKQRLQAFDPAFAWTVTADDGTALSLDDNPLVPTNASRRTLHLKPGLLLPGQLYLACVHATSSDGIGSACLGLATPSAPVGIQLQIEPSSGSAATLFLLRAVGGQTVRSSRLWFTFGYLSADGTPFVLSGPSTQREVWTYLPAAELGGPPLSVYATAADEAASVTVRANVSVVATGSNPHNSNSSLAAASGGNVQSLMQLALAAATSSQPLPADFPALVAGVVEEVEARLALLPADFPGWPKALQDLAALLNERTASVFTGALLENYLQALVALMERFCTLGLDAPAEQRLLLQALGHALSHLQHLPVSLYGTHAATALVELVVAATKQLACALAKGRQVVEDSEEVAFQSGEVTVVVQRKSGEGSTDLQCGNEDLPTAVKGVPFTSPKQASSIVQCSRVAVPPNVATELYKSNSSQNISNTSVPISDVLDVEVRNEAYGKQIVSNLTVPIEIVLPLHTANNLSNASGKCSYFHEASGKWKTDGMTKLDTNNPRAIVCLTTHLTKFALVGSPDVIPATTSPSPSPSRTSQGSVSSASSSPSPSTSQGSVSSASSSPSHSRTSQRSVSSASSSPSPSTSQGSVSSASSSPSHSPGGSSSTSPTHSPAACSARSSCATCTASGHTGPPFCVFCPGAAACLAVSAGPPDLAGQTNAQNLAWLNQVCNSSCPPDLTGSPPIQNTSNFCSLIEPSFVAACNSEDVGLPDGASATRVFVPTLLLSLLSSVILLAQSGLAN